MARPTRPRRSRGGWRTRRAVSGRSDRGRPARRAAGAADRAAAGSSRRSACGGPSARSCRRRVRIACCKSPPTTPPAAGFAIWRRWSGIRMCSNGCTTRLRDAGLTPADILARARQVCQRALARARSMPSGWRRNRTLAKLLAIYQRLGELMQPLTAKPQTAGEWAERLRSVLADGLWRAAARSHGDEAIAICSRLWNTCTARWTTWPPCPQAIAARASMLAAGLPARAGGAGQQGLPPPADPERGRAAGLARVAAGRRAGADRHDVQRRLRAVGDRRPTRFCPIACASTLGLLDNDRRLARDAYALSVLLASRKKLKLIVAPPRRRGQSARAQPPAVRGRYRPGRARALAFFGDLPPQPPRRNLLRRRSGPRLSSTLEPPRPQPLPSADHRAERDEVPRLHRLPVSVLSAARAGLEALRDDGGRAGRRRVWRPGAPGAGAVRPGRRAPASCGCDRRRSRSPSILEYQLDRIAAARYRQARPRRGPRADRAGPPAAARHLPSGKPSGRATAGGSCSARTPRASGAR